ncbi:MAG TPA: hypothetical protein PKW35_23520 [Nannocystaceae bacterium]|nr:hypothetical protein [Nannocystaceae bacterium]
MSTSSTIHPAEPRPPRVFISWSHEPDPESEPARAHQAQVLALADKLRAGGAALLGVSGAEPNGPAKARDRERQSAPLRRRLDQLLARRCFIPVLFDASTTDPIPDVDVDSLAVVGLGDLLSRRQDHVAQVLSRPHTFTILREMQQLTIVHLLAHRFSEGDLRRLVRAT